VLGGVGPSPVARELIAAFPFIDAVVEGEGEINIVNILMGDTTPTPPPRIVDDLDGLPLPAYELVDFDLYDASPSIITSRGCPYRCTFCTEPYNFGGRVRFRGIDSILEEIELVHALSGRRMFLFQDDILPLKPSRFLKLLTGLRKLSFPIVWKCFSRVDLMSDNLMEEMARSGCVQIRYGIESGSNRTLDRIRKEFTIEQAYEVAARSLRYFPSVHTSFIWGYPFEEIADFEDTLKWVDRFEKVGCSVLLFEYSPLAGSPLYRETNLPLKFSADRYSVYVLTGHERINGRRYEIEPHHRRLYEMIQSHPAIFSGFYEYKNMDILEMRHRLARFHKRRRTPVRNEFDL
jgi:anaerobic magnesium-protoporphyrin IX monomethyl ester cyclase